MRFARAVVAAWLTTPAFGADAPAPGQYIAKGGWGTLTLKPNGEAEIESVGGNAHTCSLSGKLEGWSIKADGDECIVHLKRLPNGLTVAPAEGEACRSFCGMRAMMDGDYLIPPPGCGDGARDATRKAFKALYDAKRYPEALEKLAPVVTRCKDQIGWLENQWLLNDLALTHYRAGDRAACVKTLAPLAEDAAATDDALQKKYPPSDYDSAMPAIKAARANLKLCGG